MRNILVTSINLVHAPKNATEERTAKEVREMKNGKTNPRKLEIYAAPRAYICFM